MDNPAHPSRLQRMTYTEVVCRSWVGQIPSSCLLSQRFQRLAGDLVCGNLKAGRKCDGGEARKTWVSGFKRPIRRRYPVLNGDFIQIVFVIEFQKLLGLAVR